MSTRDKLREYAAGQAVTLDVAIDRLLAEHAEREFWAAMAKLSPGEYQAQMQAEGQWPSDDDYGLEDTMAQPQPPAQPVPAPLSEDE
ncbi:hypothetical protein [Cellulosimicrobium sp. BE325]|uniref:hypothetical protein n=1 Tax=Cellulosimicrobium sp. 4261 TaxID=3156458 RepID=UPI001AE2E1EF